MKTRDITSVALFAAMAVVAAVALRFGGETVVPFSIMPLVVMLAGALLGSKKGALSMLVYLLIGLVGIPVFASPPYGGPTYIFVPSFGFLVGFIAAAFIIGRVLEAKENPSLGRYYSAMVAGLVVIYLIGLPYLYLILNFYLPETSTTFWAMVAQARPGSFAIVILFLFDLIKAAIAVAIAKPVAARVKAASLQ